MNQYFISKVLAAFVVNLRKDFGTQAGPPLNNEFNEQPRELQIRQRMLT